MAVSDRSRQLTLIPFPLNSDNGLVHNMLIQLQTFKGELHKNMQLNLTCVILPEKKGSLDVTGKPDR